MKKRLIALIPLAVFLSLSFFLWRGLSLDPRKIPSPLIEKPIPEFSLPRLSDESQVFSAAQLKGQVSLLNVWATWCLACRDEHQSLLDIAREGVTIYGLDYKDNRQDALQWLNALGNPYQAIAFDGEGRVAIDWGVYGAPETFIIDKHGIIRYKHVGMVTAAVWKKRLGPLYRQLKQER